MMRDRQGELEQTIGALVVSYGQLMFLVGSATARMLNAQDPALGRLAIKELSDAGLLVLWFKAARRLRVAEDRNLQRLNRELNEVRTKRNELLHGFYVPMFDGVDPQSALDLRSAPWGRGVISEEAFRAEAFDLDAAHSVSARCVQLRAELMGILRPYLFEP
jgi:hypothetical protein